MSTATTSVTLSTSSAATENFGDHLGSRLRGGEIIELVSDLGGGKTTLVRGIARGSKSRDVVGSPTFTLSKVYRAPKFAIYHFDFYRLNDAGLVAFELEEILHNHDDVVVVEWGEIVQQVLPLERLTIQLNKTAEDNREITCTYPASLRYLFDAHTDH